MKILWISPTPSHPQDAGNRAHIYALGREVLTAGHDVTFFLYGQEHTTPESHEEMRSFWTNFHYLPHKLKNRIKSKDGYWGIDDWFNSDISTVVEFIKGQTKFDVVICEYVFFSKALTLFDKSTLKILNCHDRMSGRAEMLIKNGIEPDFFYTSPDEERIALDRADLILAIQQDEKAYFESLTERCVIEVGYPISSNSSFVQRKYSGELPLRVGYLGSNNSLNRKSVSLMLNAIENDGKLSKKVDLLFAGSICNAVKQRATCLGFVEKEVDFYNQIDLFINPMIDGTGLKIKTLSAIQHGMPFLATEPASVGIPVSLEEHKCKDIDTLIAALNTVVNAPSKWLPLLKKETKKTLSLYLDIQKEQFNNFLKAIATKNIRHLRRKRILLVTDIPFWEPGVGSHSRISSLVKALEKSFSITIFFYGSLWKSRREEIISSGINAEFVSYKDWETKVENVKFSSEIGINVPGLSSWKHEIFGRALKAYLNSEDDFDCTIIEYIRLAYLRDSFSEKVVSILDTHDLMAPREWRFSLYNNQTSISISLKDELDVLEKFSAVIAIQNMEAAWLKCLLKSALPICCPHGVEVKSKRTSTFAKVTKDSRLKLGFVGATSEANIGALEWFVKQVWPVVSQLPIELHVYGSVCESVSFDNKTIKLHGLVQSLDYAYTSCDVMINPILFGGGLKIKSIEALAHGKPLISSPEGAVGIDQPESSGVIVANSRQEFIDAIILLANSESLRISMAKAAFQAAQNQFSPNVCFDPLIKFIEGI